jgi:probable rRNA maturation factor
VSGELAILNRQRKKAVNLPVVRRLVTRLMNGIIAARDYELTIHIVGAAEMEKENHAHLGHCWSTDVITLDYSEPFWPLAGEIIVCADEAMIQAVRFRTSWQAEVARYIVHGILHLQGYDDRRAADRRKMKRREDAVMRALSREFDLRKLGGEPRLTA